MQKSNTQMNNITVTFRLRQVVHKFFVSRRGFLKCQSKPLSTKTLRSPAQPVVRVALTHETGRRRKWCVICVVCVVSHAGLVDVCIGWRPKSVGTSMPEWLLRRMAPIDMSCCKAASMHWLDTRLPQVWAKVGLREYLGSRLFVRDRRQKRPRDSGRGYVAGCGLRTGSAEG